MRAHYHFIGIGGVGMSALAHILLDKGYLVSGSDLSTSDATKALLIRGATIFSQHKSDQVKKGQIVVYSTALGENNPEMLEAKRCQCTILHRSELLEKLLKEKKALIVAGAHGKTTTTALLSHVLTRAQLDPSYVIGGFCQDFPANGKAGNGEYFVAEGDESDGSFLRSTPYGAIITNIDFDHLDYWKSKESLLEGYHQFISKIVDSDFFFYSSDDPYSFAKGSSFGFSKGADFQIVDVRMHNHLMRFTIKHKKHLFRDIDLQIWGRHNVLNALGVFAFCFRLGIDVTTIREAFMTFRGVKRRLEYKGSLGSISLLDDYAHHPKEIQACMDAVQEMYPDRRIVTIFQPHRYSRSKDFLVEFIDTLKKVENLIVTDIYAAGEDSSKGITTKEFCSALEEQKKFYYVKRDALSCFITDYLQENDVLLTVGAGDITKLSQELLNREKQCASLK